MDDPIGSHLTNAEIIQVGDVEVSGGVGDDGGGGVQSGADGRAAIAGEVFIAVACDGGDDALGSHLADALIIRIGNVEVPLLVQTEAGRLIERGLRGRAAIAGESLLPIAGIDSAYTGGSDPADGAAVSLGDKKIAGAVY